MQDVQRARASPPTMEPTRWVAGGMFKMSGFALQDTAPGTIVARYSHMVGRDSAALSASPVVTRSSFGLCFRVAAPNCVLAPYPNGGVYVVATKYIPCGFELCVDREATPLEILAEVAVAQLAAATTPHMQ